MTATQREETLPPATADQDRPIHLIGLPAPISPKRPPRRLSFANKIILEKVGHRLKSAVAKPVVVIMEDT